MASAQSKPPRDGISISEARREYHLCFYVIKRMIEAGKIKAGSGLKKAGKGKCMLVSRRDCERIAKGLSSHGDEPLTALPSDAKPLGALVAELGSDICTLKTWCTWKVHPALGRKLASGIGTYTITGKNDVQRQWRGLMASKADVAACIEATKNPLHRPLRGQAGMWIDTEIFQDENKQLWFTSRYIENHYRAINGNDGMRWHEGYGRAQSRKVVRPGAPTVGWLVTVWSQRSVETLLAYRQGKVDGGEWLVCPDIWRDAEGNWYSSKWLGRKLEMTKTRISHLRRDFFTKFKNVPLEQPEPKQQTEQPEYGEGRRGRRPGQPPNVVAVHHESEVAILLGWPMVQAKPEATAPVAVPEQPTPAPKLKGGRPADPRVEEVQKYLYDRWIAGDNLAAIRSGAEAKFGSARAPKEAAHVTLLAKRYAKKNGLPDSRK